MDYEGYFKERLDALRSEGRYRVFADLERRCGRFPRAFDYRIGAEVTVWCSIFAAIAHDMVEALASDRADQPFNMTVLPR
jgi:hypothetical protein